MVFSSWYVFSSSDSYPSLGLDERGWVQRASWKVFSENFSLNTLQWRPRWELNENSDESGSSAETLTRCAATWAAFSVGHQHEPSVWGISVRHQYEPSVWAFSVDLHCEPSEIVTMHKWSRIVWGPFSGSLEWANGPRSLAWHDLSSAKEC